MHSLLLSLPPFGRRSLPLASCSLFLPSVGVYSAIRFNCFSNKKGTVFILFLLFFSSQLPDLNRIPARYEGAALPGELSWQNNSAMPAIHFISERLQNQQIVIYLYFMLFREFCQSHLAYFL